MTFRIDYQTDKLTEDNTPLLFAKNKEYSHAHIARMHNFFTLDMPEYDQFEQDTINTNLTRFNH